MAQRAFWKGYLKLSLVTCRVAMTPAVTESNKLRFHNMNRKTGNRVVNQYVDAETGKPVDDEDQVKGYARGEDDYVLFEDEELEDVGLESTRTIDIESFVPQSSIGWIWYDSPHFLAPADKVSEEAFAVIREAMRKTQTGGIARLVLYRREHSVLLVPRDNGMVVWTLRYGDEVRDADPFFAKSGEEAPAARAKTMMKKLVEARLRDWTPKLVQDPVEERLHEIIAMRSKKSKRSKPKETPEPERKNNVIDIMEALRRSLASEKKTAPRK
ncbi:Ku protein [Rhizobium glycinendophyticum]|uniref:Non-homologous end joining protein Ku n=1 Tax=Rhizobium glycinendophyticum TaxID=2589807 RepID=A0A504UXD3_9HYPH|nr:Ku protein [Rhizobium glycinendophyticum]TPP09812.1 Ku protein [Rhizobium glycinendophyticum]